MTFEPALTMSSAWIAALAKTSVESGVLAAVVWLLVRRDWLSPRLRAAAWWLVCARFVTGLLWPVSIPVAIVPAGWLAAVTMPAVDTALPGAVSAPAASASPMTEARRPAPADFGVEAPRATPTPVAAPTDASTGVPRNAAVSRVSAGRAVTAGLMVLWTAGVLGGVFMAVRTWRGWRRLVREATPAGGALESEVIELAWRIDLRRVPAVRTSDDTSGPCVVGTFEPTLLLPTHLAARDASPLERRSAVCHELVHLRRRDEMWAWVPMLCERLFFFHPIARLAVREYALAREAACDAAVLAALDLPADGYGRMIVRFSLGARRPVLAMQAGATSMSLLRRRLIMLGQWRNRESGQGAHVFCAVLAVAALAPFALVESQPSRGEAGAVRLSSWWQAQPPPPPQPPRPPQPPVPPQPPAPLPLASSLGDDLDRIGDAWAFFDDGDHMISGGHWPSRRLRSLRQGDEALFWFRRDGREYVVRDAATLDRIRDAFSISSEVEIKQQELGVQQGRLGAEQAKLGAQQAELGAQQGQLGARIAEVALRQAERALDRVRRGRAAPGAKDDSRLDDELKDLEEQIEALAEQQEKLGEEQEALGAKQEDLGHEQEALGEAIESAVKEAMGAVGEMLDEAIESGIAEVVK